MKRILCLCVTALLVLALVGCESSTQNQPTQNTSSFNDRGEVASLDSTDKTLPENKQLTSVGAPPVSETLQQLYMGAEEMARAFTLCSFQTDTTQTVTKDDTVYLVICDPRFPTYSELQTYLEGYFTKEFIEQTLLTADGCVQKGENDQALVLSNSATENNKYAGHVFRVDSQTEQAVSLTATAYYSADVFLENYFFQTPSNAKEFTTKEFSFQVEYTQEGWRFSAFPFMRG